MAAIMECPACHTMLKEEGDEMKVHKYTYVVFDLDEETRILQCGFCGFAGETSQWPD
jgi:hypothetical protein